MKPQFFHTAALLGRLVKVAFPLPVSSLEACKRKINLKPGKKATIITISCLQMQAKWSRISSRYVTSNSSIIAKPNSSRTSDWVKACSQDKYF
jgi:hypothetical protein